jgi:hypothetical protein
VERDRRLRLDADVASRPGRSRLEVPLGALRPLRAGRRHTDPRQKSASGAAEQAGTEIAGRTAARSHVIYQMSEPAAARLSRVNNGQTFRRAWRG